MELFGATRTRGLLLTEEMLYPLELRRHELGKRDSDAHLKVPKTCGIPVTPFPIKEPRAGLEPAASEVQAPRSGQMS
jgi:hypothetical protein